MGLYDSIHFLGDDAKRVPCAAGHPQHREFQTKDWGADMSRLFVREGRVWKAKVVEVPIVATIRDGHLILSHETCCDPVSNLEPAVIYKGCGECQPVLVEGNSDWGSDSVNETFPEVRYEIRCVNGDLSIRPERVESREELRLRLARSGCVVIPDDDRIAAKHFLLCEREHE